MFLCSNARHTILQAEDGAPLCLTCLEACAARGPSAELLRGVRAVSAAVPVADPVAWPALVAAVLQAARCVCLSEAVGHRPSSSSLSLTAAVGAAVRDALVAMLEAPSGSGGQSTTPRVLGGRPCSPPPAPPNALVGDLIAALEGALRDDGGDAAGAFADIVADVAERSQALRQGVCSSGAALSRLLLDLYVGAALPQGCGRAVESLLFLTHLVFTEARQVPRHLELLAEVLWGAGGGSYTAALAQTLHERGDDAVIAGNALGLLHFLLSHETTAAAAVGAGAGGGAAEAILRAAAPFLLAADEAVALLGCGVSQAALAALRRCCGGAALHGETAAWLSDYSAEALRGVSRQVAVAVLPLMDELALAGAGAAAWGGEERLRALFAVAAHSPNAFERALDGPYARALLADGGLSAAQVGGAVQSVVARGAAGDDDVGPPLSLRCVLRLVGALADVAGEPAALPAEVVAAAAHAVVDALRRAAPHTAGDSCAEETPSLPPAAPSLAEDMPVETAQLLLSAVAFLLGAAPALRPTAVAALADVTAGRFSVAAAGGGAAAQIAAHFAETHFAADGVCDDAAAQFCLLARGGLFDAVLSATAATPAAAEGREALVAALARHGRGAGGGVETALSIDGASSLGEVVVRCESAADGVLLALAAFGCDSPVEPAELAEAVQRALAAVVDAAGSGASVGRAVGRLLRLYGAHHHWHGRLPAPSPPQQPPQLPAPLAVGRDGDGAEVAAALAAVADRVDGAPVPQFLAALLSDPALRGVSAAVCVAALLAGAPAPWHHTLLTAAAGAGEGEALLDAAFAVISAPRGGGADRPPPPLRAGLLDTVAEWLRALPGHSAAPLALHALERHLVPLLLQWGAAGGGPGPVTAAAAGRTVVRCLSRLPPAAGSGTDGVLLRWCLRALVDGGGDRTRLQLLCLLLERCHGAEVARRCGRGVADRLCPDGGPSAAVLRAVVEHLIDAAGGRGTPDAVDGWRRWYRCLPETLLTRPAEAPPAQRLLAVRVCDFALSGAPPRKGPLTAVGAAEARATAVVVEWCVALLLAGEADGRHAACRVLHALLRAYATAVADTLPVVGLYALCTRDGSSLLRGAARGWALAALLHATPHASWAVDRCARVAACARVHLSTLGDDPGDGPLDSEEEVREAVDALRGACARYAALVPDAAPFPLHRADDYFGAVAAAEVPQRHFLIQNDVNITMTS